MCPLGHRPESPSTRFSTILQRSQSTTAIINLLRSVLPLQRRPVPSTRLPSEMTLAPFNPRSSASSMSFATWSASAPTSSASSRPSSRCRSLGRSQVFRHLAIAPYRWSVAMESSTCAGCIFFSVPPPSPPRVLRRLAFSRGSARCKGAGARCLVTASVHASCSGNARLRCPPGGAPGAPGGLLVVGTQPTRLCQHSRLGCVNTLDTAGSAV